MQHEVMKLNSNCNCELEFEDIVEAVVLVYQDSVDIYYQHTKDEIAVSVLPGKKCLAMLSTTADYLLLKKKGKKLTFKQGYTYGEYPCYERIKIRFKNNDVVVERKKDKRERRIRGAYELDEMSERMLEEYDRKNEAEYDPIADLGDVDFKILEEGVENDE